MSGRSMASDHGLGTRDWVGVAGLLLAGGTLALGGGLTGIAAAVGLVAIGLVTAPLPAFVAGQLFVLVGLSTASPVPVIAVQIGLFAVVTEPARTLGVRAPLVVAVGSLLLGAVVSLVVLPSVTTGWLAVLLVGAVGVFIYGCHRFVRVRLGLADAAPAQLEDHV